MAIRLLSECDNNFSTETRYNRGGCGYLKKHLRAFNHAALQGNPFLVMIDLDNSICPAKLISDCLQGTRQSSNLLVRIAVREAEAWLLADNIELPKHISVAPALFPADVENLPDAKQKLLNLVRKSKKKTLVPRLCPAPKSTAVIGPEYNDFFAEFVLYSWNFECARGRSRSLQRAYERVKSFAPTWSPD